MSKRKRKTYFSPNVLWLKHFFYYVGDTIPLEKITSVRGYKIPLTKSVQSCANITKVGQKYRITLNLYENDYIANKHYPKHLEFILSDLAHEMAHVLCWDHDSEHFKLTAQLMLKFSEVLKGLGLEQTDLPHTKLDSNNE